MKNKISVLFMLLFVTCLCGTVTVKAESFYDPQKVVGEAVRQANEFRSYSKNYCLGWVAETYANVYGIEANGLACCAHGYSTHKTVSNSRDNIPVGAVVFFDYKQPYQTPDGHCGTCNGYYGHIGIYIGNGQIVHSFDWGNGTHVYINTIEDIERVYNYSKYVYTGWGWYGGVELYSEAKINFDTAGGYFDVNKTYTDWSDTKETTSPVTESDTMKLVGTVTKYRYYHCHNNYSGYATMLDSVQSEGYWGYCGFDSYTKLTETKSFSDRGGKTYICIGSPCQYGYTYYFEDEYIAYQYQERSLISSTDITRRVGSNYGTLPTPARKGYNFAGWKNSAGNVITADTVVPREKEILLTASWTTTPTPSKTALTKVSSSSKKITTTCKSIKGVNYEVQISTSRFFFSNNVVVNLKSSNNKLTSKSLKEGTYYVRARTYTVDSCGNKTYSAWTSIEKVKVKK